MPNDEKKGGVLRDIIKLKALKIGYGILTMVFIAILQWLQEYFGVDLTFIIELLKL